MKLNILLLCNEPKIGNDANTIVDHIGAIKHYSTHNIWVYSNIGDMSYKLDLNRFDVIIIHYSLGLLTEHYLSKKTKQRIKTFNGLKVVFVQDEYRQVNKMVSELSFLDIDILFTCFPESEIENIYPSSKLPGVRKENNLTGYIPHRLTKMSEQPSTCERSIHVGYRGRKLPYWYGELAFEKWNIVDKWQHYIKDTNLISDVSYNENSRLYGRKWIDFLLSCKTTLGVESGASIIDFTGELEKKIELYQLTHPHDSFYTVQKKYLLEYEGKHYLNQISPRCFEAIALKTVLVLYEGEYSGILVPNRHYIPLKKDFSNINDVLALIQNDSYLQNMADTAFNEIALNPDYSYQTFIKEMDTIILEEFSGRQKNKIYNSYDTHQFLKDIKNTTLKNKAYKITRMIYQHLPSTCRLYIRNVFRPRLIIKSLTQQVFKWVRKKESKQHYDSSQ